MSLKKKLLSGFFTIVFLIAALSAVVVWLTADIGSLMRVQAEAYAPEAMESVKLSENLLSAGYNLQIYRYSRDENLHNRGMAFLDGVEVNIRNLQAILDTQGDALPQLKGKWTQVVDTAREYRVISLKIHDCLTRMDLHTKLEEAGEKVASLLAGYYGGYRALAAAETDRTDRAALSRRFDRYVAGLAQTRQVADANLRIARGLGAIDAAVRTDNFTAAIKGMDGMLAIMRNTLATTSLPDWQAKAKVVIAAMEEWNVLVNEVHQLDSEVEALAAERDSNYQALVRTLRELTTDGLGNIVKSSVQSSDSTQRALRAAMGLGTIGIVIGLVLGLAIARSITINTGMVIDSLGSIAVNLEASSHAVRETFRRIALDTGQQAASLDETSSEIERMAAGVSQNAGNVRKTAEITAAAVKRVHSEDQAMLNMISAMTDINKQSDKIGHIIKTIEEIAFQTNLLALNAAVEAARAGEAGKGFAVVAGEVGNLAQRSAQAARDTTELIQTTIERVDRGMGLVEDLGSGFREIKSDIGTVSELIEQINAATREQSAGVDKINGAIAQIDKITQGNAAASANASEESETLSRQADALGEAMRELNRVVHGATARQSDAPRAADGA
ncbi:MAG: methyl-accepting chemotaxis protein [Planctomycetota bacterium]|jgi:hypothetical protein|nr:methyl-accepting chemotaxis protein [Planctomycetota bacterium]